MTASGRSRLLRTRTWFVDHGLELVVGIFVLVTGIVLRRWVLHSPLGDADLDESTVGVQALRFGHGHLATFFPHQAYGGTVETFLVSLVFHAAGSSVFTLKVVPMACAAGAAVVTWRSAIRLGLGRLGQWCAPILVWMGPAFAVAFSTKERGFYGVAILVAATDILLVLRLDARPNSGDLFLLGALVGLGWWQTPLTMLVAVPALGWLVARKPRLVVSDAMPYVALVIGGAPWFIWNARNRWVSMNGGYAFGTSWWQRFESWMEKLRVVAGIETPFVSHRSLLGGRWTGAVIVGVIVVGATWRTRHRAPGLFAVLVLGYGVLYATNGLAAGVGGDPRYTYLLVPVVALAVASLLPDLLSDLWSAGLTVVVGALVAALTAWGLAGMGHAAGQPQADKFLSSPGIEEVAAYLQRSGRQSAITDDAGMQITFLTKEHVEAGSFSVPRYADLEAAGRQAKHSTYVLEDHLQDNAGRLRLYLVSHHIGYRARHIGKWWVFLVDRRVLPERIPLIIFPLNSGTHPAPKPHRAKSAH